MKNYSYIILAAVLGLSACVNDDIYNTPHPNKGVVILNTDWSARASAINVPEKFNLDLADVNKNLNSMDALPGNFTLPLQNDGEFGLRIYATGDGVEINKNEGTITLATLENGEHETNPGAVFTALDKVIIKLDDTTRVSTKVYQRNFEVKFTINVIGDITKIAGITALLDNTATQFNFLMGRIVSGSLSSIKPQFQPAGTRQFVATIRTFGGSAIEGAAQNLRITVARNGTTQRFDSDVADYLNKNLSNKANGVATLQSAYEPVEIHSTLTIPDNDAEAMSMSQWSSF